MILKDLYTLISYSKELENYIEFRLKEGVEDSIWNQLISEVESINKRINQLTKEKGKYYYEKRIQIESRQNRHG